MCLNPGILPNGVKTGCQECWQCQSVIINDWLGRIKSETNVADWFIRLDLTYRPNADGTDPGSAKVLRYRDVQNYLKRIRKAGYKVRYLVAGEYGSGKGRAHWHMLMWGHGPNPYESFPAETEKTDDLRYWQNGFVYLIHPQTDQRIKYVIKYAMKDHQAKYGTMTEPLRMSTQPIIGRKFIRELAQRYVDNHLVPQDNRYEIDGEWYKLRGRGAEIFLEDYRELWMAAGNRHMQDSEYVEAYFDKKAREEMELERPIQEKPAPPQVPRPKAPYKGQKIYWTESLLMWSTQHPVTGAIELWKPDDKGEWRWQVSRSAPANAEFRDLKISNIELTEEIPF
jgi:hypothetical protein